MTTFTGPMIHVGYLKIGDTTWQWMSRYTTRGTFSPINSYNVNETVIKISETDR